MGVLIAVGLIAAGRLALAVVILAGFALLLVMDVVRRFMPDDSLQTRTYDATRDDVLAAVRDAIDKRGYRLTDDADDGECTLRFRTRSSIWSYSGQDVCVVVRPLSDRRTEVTMQSRIARSGLGSIQTFSWGEGGRITAKVLDGIADELEQARGDG